MIEILMATYNGAEYVEEQLDSIVTQTNQNWHLTICDDMSTDRTRELVERYVDRYPEKMTLHENTVNSGSAGANFMELLQLADADYVMFCDQDDVWLPNKIEMTYRAMKRMEQKYGERTPLLVHTDVMVADRELQVVSPSLMELQELEGYDRTFAKQLVQNCVTGCTVMMNRTLVEKAKLRPVQMIMHDWWVALVAAAFGHIGYVSTPTMLYRQHGGNAEGAKNYRSVSQTVKMAKQRDAILRSIQLTYDQAMEFYVLYGAGLSEKQYRILTDYCGMQYKTGILRLVTALRRGYLKTGWNRRIGHLLYLLLGDCEKSIVK